MNEIEMMTADILAMTGPEETLAVLGKMGDERRSEFLRRYVFPTAIDEILEFYETYGTIPRDMIVAKVQELEEILTTLPEDIGLLVAGDGKLLQVLIANAYLNFQHYCANRQSKTVLNFETILQHCDDYFGNIMWEMAIIEAVTICNEGGQKSNCATCPHRQEKYGSGKFVYDMLSSLKSGYLAQAIDDPIHECIDDQYTGIIEFIDYNYAHYCSSFSAFDIIATIKELKYPVEISSDFFHLFEGMFADNVSAANSVILFDAQNRVLPGFGFDIADPALKAEEIDAVFTPLLLTGS